MVAVHEGDADALRRGFEHQWTGIELVDAGRFQPGHADGAAPFVEGFGHLAVDQHGHPLQLFGHGDAARPFGERARGDGKDLVAIEPDGVEGGVDVAGERDRGIDAVAHAGLAVAAGLYVDMQVRRASAQFGQAREEPLLREQRQDVEAQAQLARLADRALYRVAHRVERGGERGQQPFPSRVEAHGVMVAVEQRFADVAFERLDAARAGGHRQREIGRRGLDRARPRHRHECFEPAERRQPAQRILLCRPAPAQAARERQSGSAPEPRKRPVRFLSCAGERRNGSKGVGRR